MRTVVPHEVSPFQAVPSQVSLPCRKPSMSFTDFRAVRMFGPVGSPFRYCFMARPKLTAAAKVKPAKPSILSLLPEDVIWSVYCFSSVCAVGGAASGTDGSQYSEYVWTPTP